MKALGTMQLNSFVYSRLEKIQCVGASRRTWVQPPTASGWECGVPDSSASQAKADTADETLLDSLQRAL